MLHKRTLVIATVVIPLAMALFLSVGLLTIHAGPKAVPPTPTPVSPSGQPHSNPGTVPTASDPIPTPAILAVPPLVPPSTEAYTPYAAGSPIAAADSRPVAQLAPGAVGAQPAATFFPILRPPVSEISYTILASVQYTVNGHLVFVTTARPSPAAAQRQLGLGNEKVQLADGTTAWVATGIPSGQPNQVVTMRNGLIITVASDLPIDTLKDLAAHVAVK